MSWTDERYVVHPSPDDRVTPWGTAHIACCRTCIVNFGYPELGLCRIERALPLEQIGVPPGPTGRARHRKDDACPG